MKNKDRVARIKALYARIPAMKDCKGLCMDSCTVIPTVPLEKKLIEKKLGFALEPRAAILNNGLLRCSALTGEGKCSVYEMRPMICRAFGAVDHTLLRCDHGCVPVRWMDNNEFREIMLELEDLGGGPLRRPYVEGFPDLNNDQLLQAAAEFLKAKDR